MKVTKSQLQQLIREEYARVILESKGYNPTHRQVQVLAENLDEGFFDAFGKAFGAGKAAYKTARAEDQEKTNEVALVKTEEQLKKDIAGIRMKAKDKLKSNGYVGETENDTAVAAIDLFRAAVKEIMSSSEAPGAPGRREASPRATYSAGRRN